MNRNDFTVTGRRFLAGQCDILLKLPAGIHVAEMAVSRRLQGKDERVQAVHKKNFLIPNQLYLRCKHLDLVKNRKNKPLSGLSRKYVGYEYCR